MQVSPSPSLRLDALRDALRRRGLSGFLVPRADEHQGEYVPASAKRLSWLTGFTGSAGMAVALLDRALLFVDGRYTLQVREETDSRAYEFHHLLEEPPADWLRRNLAAGERIGYDPWLHTPDEVRRLSDACAAAGGELVAVEGNPIDELWADRPAPPRFPAFSQPLAYSGRVSLDKRREIAALLDREGEDAVVLTQTDSVAWLLNVRGRDLPGTPVVLSSAVMRRDATVDWFVDPGRIPAEVRAHLDAGVRIRPGTEFVPALGELGAKGLKVRIDPAGTPQAVADALARGGARLGRGADPCLLPKACKNSVELDGMRRAHRRDAVALARFLAWFQASAVGLSEKAIAQRLLEFRREQDEFFGVSFPTIAGAGPNGAVVHYHVRGKTARTLAAGEPLLLDSGGQYRDGTTDVTRTLVVGDPDPEVRHRYTRVLQGHIDLADAVFPAGTAGIQLDALARRPLWREGLDFDHGTGHGVGCFLSVHEGPQRISRSGSSVALRPGMVVSDEPGYYKDGAYGIRIENLLAVCEIEGGSRPMLGFETLTLAPYERRLIVPGLLTREQRDWIDAYHGRVREIVAPELEGAARDWLVAATRPL